MTPLFGSASKRKDPTVTCPTCGFGQMAGLPYCQECGVKMGPGGFARCRDCNAPVGPEARFCPACGMPHGMDDVRPPDPEGENPKIETGYRLDRLDEYGKVQEEIKLDRTITVIGRVGATLNFPDDPYLSPRHAELSFRGGKVFLRDLGSRNGTWRYFEEPHKLQDGDLTMVGSQIFRFRRLGYPGPNPPEADQTRRLGSLTPPNADIASLSQLRSDGSVRDVLHLSPGRDVLIGRDQGDWTFPYDASMSGLHAKIHSEDADFIILDAGSRNGVAITVRGEMELAVGRRFLLGDKTLRLEQS
ncbi:MAG: FHA domain-containing protein [Gemmatimonadota bacterium]|nr:FHA domain-containing protein [Gemmatimonadota bacterium]